MDGSYYINRPSFRDYQQYVDTKIELAEQNNESSVVCQPTGTGKSLIFINRAINKVIEGKTVAIIVPSIELLFNIEKYLKKLTPKIYKFFYTPICSNLRYRPGKRLYIGTYGSFLKKYQDMRIKPDYFIHDEAHHCKSKTWEKIARLPGFHLAFTATPLRLDGRSLNDLFPGFIDTGHDLRWFIEQGYLSDFVIKSTFTVEFEHQGGIDNLKYQSENLDKKELLGDAVTEWKKHANGRKTIVFTTGHEHSRHVLEAYLEAGIPAATIDSKMSFEERKEVLDGFRTGKYLVIINVAILVEGVDVPDAECVQLLRFTNSVSLYFQMIGRILRPSENPGIILDHAGNVEHHMSPDCPIDWRELYYAQIDVKNISEYNPFITCLCCDKPILKKSERPDYTINKVCPYCTYENTIEPPEKRKPVSTKKGSLIDFEMSRAEQLLYKIYQSDKPHQIKVKMIMNSLQHPFIGEKDVENCLKILYKDHPQKDEVVANRLQLAKKRSFENKLKKVGKL